MGMLDGKVIVITGAAQGHGAAEARYFVQEGAAVVLGDIADDGGRQVAEELGGSAVHQKLDVRDPADWQSIIDVAETSFGKLDGLVNNAALLRTGSIEEMTLEDYEAVIDVNQVGSWLGMKAAIPALRRSGGGSIVNISSTSGLRGLANISAYAASKFALRGMSKVAAIELGKDRIRVNSVHPGFIESPMTEGQNPSEYKSRSASDIPLGRSGTVEEVAATVAFLLSDAATFCTGAEFLVEGGAMA